MGHHALVLIDIVNIKTNSLHSLSSSNSSNRVEFNIVSVWSKGTHITTGESH